MCYVLVGHTGNIASVSRDGVRMLTALLFLIFLVVGFSTRTLGGLASPGSVGGWLVAASGGPAALVANTEQIERGKALFASRCAGCHGSAGQGGDGPRLIGSPNGLAGYQTAQRLFEYTSAEMPADSPGSLKPAEVWDVLAFILDSNRLLPPGTTLGPDNAATNRLSR
jgi:cytochrome c